ncbi:MAG: DUF4159 domain-containing protein [Pirellulaceae bacterium]
MRSQYGSRFLLLLLVVGLFSISLGQPGGSRAVPDFGQRINRRGVPDWENDVHFKHDLFTFVRVRYDSWRSRNKWRTDYPKSDLNFSFRLQQLTSLKVHPEGKVLNLTDKDLFNYPFIYMVEPGDLMLSEDEVKALRRYLLNGGFMMVDDFWGEREWENFEHEILRVFPDRKIVDLPQEHEIFNCVYQLNDKPQVPSIGWALRGRNSGITWERPDAREAHYRAILDDHEQIIVMICHNTDLGDGWEREGEDEWYFREFSEKKAYPLGINIVTYAMTH